MMNLADSIAARVRELRLAKGWSQERLAEEAGLSTDAISRIERGDRGPRLETLDQIAQAVGLPLQKLVDFGEPPPRSRSKDELTLSGERSLNQMDPWLVKALTSIVRRIARAQLRERRRKRPAKGTKRTSAGS
jgi:transcriptional regulator with XRE-family HTH domain